MDNLFILLILASLIALIVGMFKPDLVLRFVDEEKRSRKKVGLIFGTIFIVSLIALGMTPAKEITEADKEDAPKVEDKAEEEEEEKLSLTVIAEELFKKNVEDMDYENLKYAIEIIDDEESYNDSDRELILKNEVPIRERYAQELKIKEEQDEKDRVEREKQEEIDRIAREKAEEEQRIADEKAEAEKYNTGITWKDMARDKDGRKGEFVKFKGKVIQVLSAEGTSQYRMNVDSNRDQTILMGISNDKLEANILEGDIVTIEGISIGNITYDTAIGSQMTVPGIIVENVYQ